LYEEYARAAADPEFMKELLEEYQLWDKTVGDGLEDEEPYGEP
jgi:hypothetical protein